jgi:transcriptional regulator with XRE-family HTH domain
MDTNLNAEGRKVVGRRMKQAAEEEHLTGYEVGARLGVPHSTVYKWWAGQQLPRRDMMIEYARLTRKTFGWFYGDQSEEDRDRRVKSTLVKFLAEIAQGRDVADLLEIEFGPMSEEARVLWSLHTQNLRGGLQSEFDKRAQGLTPAERREALEMVAELAQRRVAEKRGELLPKEEPEPRNGSAPGSRSRSRRTTSR